MRLITLTYRVYMVLPDRSRDDFDADGIPSGPGFINELEWRARDEYQFAWNEDGPAGIRVRASRCASCQCPMEHEEYALWDMNNRSRAICLDCGVMRFARDLVIPPSLLEKVEGE